MTQNSFLSNKVTRFKIATMAFIWIIVFTYGVVAFWPIAIYHEYEVSYTIKQENVSGYFLGSLTTNYCGSFEKNQFHVWMQSGFKGKEFLTAVKGLNAEVPSAVVITGTFEVPVKQILCWKGFNRFNR
jgi:hypothetical protein